MALLFKVSRSFGAGLNLGNRLGVFKFSKAVNVSGFWARNDYNFTNSLTDYSYRWYATENAKTTIKEVPSKNQSENVDSIEKAKPLADDAIKLEDKSVTTQPAKEVEVSKVEKLKITKSDVKMNKKELIKDFKNDDKNILIKEKVADQVLALNVDKSTNEKSSTPQERFPVKRRVTLLDDLKYLDSQVRRIGRIDKNQIDKLLDKCKVGMSSLESVMLLRCTGGLLVRESCADRRLISEQVWKVIQKCCPDVTVEMRNAMLSTRLDNGAGFEPAEVLKEFEECGLVPNKETFQLLLTQYCELGQVDKALDLLNYMKTQDWTISITTIHSLIRGYMKSGNVTEAKNIIKGMAQHGLRPTPDTYTTLLACHAEKNDIGAIKEVMREVSSKSLKIPLRNAYEVVLKLASAGHSSSINEVLEILNPSEQLRQQHFQQRQQMYLNRFATRQRSLDYHDMFNCVLQMLSMDCREGALHVLKYSVNNVLLSDNEERFSIGLKSTMTELLRKGKPINDLMNVRRDLIENNLLTKDLEPLANLALRLQDANYILNLFNVLKTEGFQFKCHYFWPALYKAANKKQVEEVYKLTDFLSKTSIDYSDSASLAKTIFNWSFVLLVEQCGQKYTDVLERYKDLGIAKSMRDMFEMSYLVRSGSFTETHNLIDNSSKHNIQLIINNLSHGWVANKFNSKELVDFIKILNLRSYATTKNNSAMLLSLLKVTDPALRSEHFNNLIERWIEADLKLTQRFIHPLKIEAGRRAVTPDLVKKLPTLLTSANMNFEFESPITKDLDDQQLHTTNTTTTTTKSSTSTKRQQQQQQQQKENVERGNVVAAGSRKNVAETGKNVAETKKNVAETKKSVAVEDIGKDPVALVKQHLRMRDYKGFRTTVHELSEKPNQLSALLSIEKLVLPRRLNSFFHKRLFCAHINENRAQDLIDKFKATPSIMGKYISTEVLDKLTDADVKLFQEVESLLLSQLPTLHYRVPSSSSSATPPPSSSSSSAPPPTSTVAAAATTKTTTTSATTSPTTTTTTSSGSETLTPGTSATTTPTSTTKSTTKSTTSPTTTTTTPVTPPSTTTTPPSATTTTTTSTTTAAPPPATTTDGEISGGGVESGKEGGALYFTPYLALYMYYLRRNQVDKVEALLKMSPVMRNRLRLGLICKGLKMENNEPLLRKMVDLHEDKENPKRTIPCFNNLLLMKCETNDYKSALNVYNEALSRGLLFDHFSVRSLQALQSVLQGNNQPMPWKEGELEKKAELASRKDSSSSSSSDSDK